MTNDKESVERLLGYQLRTGYDIQSGDCTESPAVVFADADYEVGDGSCGLYGDQKTANEPAIPYVRIDSLLSIAAERDALKAEVDELEASSRIWEALHETLNDKLAALEAQPVKVKALKWEERRAHKLGAGPYEIACNGSMSDLDAMWRVRFHGKVICKQIKGADRAVKWANAHHEKEILSALDTTHSQAIRDAALEEAAGVAENFTTANHVAQDIKVGVFPSQSPAREAIASAIRQLKDTDQ